MTIFLNLIAASSGGQITRAKEFLLRFPKYESDFTFIIVKEKNSLNGFTFPVNSVIINIDLKGSFFKRFKRFGWEILFMPLIMKKYKVEIYLTFSHFLPILFNKSIKTIVGVSNLAPFSKLAWKNESFFSKIRLFLLKITIVNSCKRADSILALSQTCKEYLVDQELNRDNIFVSSNGVDDFWKQETKNYDESKLNVPSKFFLYVSHFYYYKNFLRLIEAYALLPSYLKNKYSLILVGHPLNRSCFSEAKRLISKLNLKRKVLIYTNLNNEDIRFLYQKTELFIFPSLIENSPNSLLEAMKAQAPIICSDLMPMPEFCEDAAVYFDSLDKNIIRNTIQQTINNTNLINKLRKTSKLQSEKFSWDEFTIRLTKEIRILINK